MTQRFSCKALVFAMAVSQSALAASQSMERNAYVMPPESVQDLFRRDKNMASLDRLSPDGHHFVIPQFQELTDLKLMSQRMLRLAMLESDAPVMATLMARPGGGGEAPETAGARMLQWLPDGSLLTVIPPPNRGSEPVEPAVPTAPIIRRSRDKETPTSTQPFLLRTAHDERLFKYYGTAQLAIIAPGRAPRAIGTPAMYHDYWLSPDGKMILRETFDDPLSYLVGFSSFGRRLEVIDLDGRVLSEIRRLPLQDAQSRGGNPAADNLPRDVMWRPDGKGLSMLWRERANGDDAATTTPRQDRLMLVKNAEPAPRTTTAPLF